MVFGTLAGCGDKETYNEVESKSADTESIEKETERKEENVNEEDINKQEENSDSKEKKTSLLRKETHYTLEGSEAVIGGYSEYEYNNEGLAIKQTDYDSSGNIIGYEEYEYNSEGLAIKQTDYDSSGNIIEYGEAEYNNEGLPITLRVYSYNPNGDIYIWCWMEGKYDSSGNLIYICQDFATQAKIYREYSYDEFANVIEEKYYYGDSSRTYKYFYEYNELNKPTKKYTILLNGEQSTSEDEIKYDNKGEINEDTSGSHITRYEYNSNDDLIKESVYSYDSEELISWTEYEYFEQ
jgi:hypothetical protein